MHLAVWLFEREVKTAAYLYSISVTNVLSALDMHHDTE